jgi:beta-glucosidase
VVKNTGKVAGKEVVQLYLSAPARDIHKPSKELKGFAKSKLLKPGESQTISFSLQAKDLASFDEGSTSWVAEPGKYTVHAGNAVNNLPVQAGFELPAKIVVEQCNKALTPTVNINELKSSR